jgi:uracil-DNA glycosylase family 4
MAGASRRPGANSDPPSIGARTLRELAREVCSCDACPRLVEWRRDIALHKRAAFANEEYWARGVPGFGDPEAAVLFLGLAPAAHGANRTGRIFTGDRSGDWLFRALHRAGLANQPTSVDRHDGLRLDGAWVTSAVKCAPPGNKPNPDERDRCREFLIREIAALSKLRVVVCLGSFAYDAATSHFAVKPKPKFGHGIEVPASAGIMLVCSFHPSQQNTFTGRLTEPMLDGVVHRAVSLAEADV